VTDQEVRAAWAALGGLLAQLREQGHATLADRLVDRVQYASTSGEIYSGVGNALWDSRATRKSLDPGGKAAWEQVLEDIDRAYKMPRPMRWIMRMWRRL